MSKRNLSVVDEMFPRVDAFITTRHYKRQHFHYQSRLDFWK